MIPWKLRLNKTARPCEQNRAVGMCRRRAAKEGSEMNHSVIDIRNSCHAIHHRFGIVDP